jgi:hypothetical protein
MNMFKDCDGSIDWFTVGFAGLMTSMAVGMVAIIVTYEPPKTFALVRDDWSCTATHTESGMSYNPAIGMNGQIAYVMTPSVETICDNYHRKGR